MKLVLMLTLIFASISAPAQDKEMMKKMKEYSTPSAAHKVLEGLTGNWTFVNKWWETLESKPGESKGTSTMKMIHGGRFLQQEIKSDMMGQSFEGTGLIGYDNLKKEYNTVWIDNMATGMMIGKGSFDAKKKVLTEEGQFTCPVKKDSMNYRGEWNIIDKDNFVYSMYSTGMTGVKEFKNMEITYKRIK